MFSFDPKTYLVFFAFNTFVPFFVLGLKRKYTHRRLHLYSNE